MKSEPKVRITYRHCLLEIVQCPMGFWIIARSNDEEFRSGIYLQLQDAFDEITAEIDKEYA
jgi:hypothetical protein